MLEFTTPAQYTIPYRVLSQISGDERAACRGSCHTAGNPTTKQAPYGVKPADGLTGALLQSGDEEAHELLGVGGYT